MTKSMAMTVFVAKEKGDEIRELSLENDESLLYSTLVKFFPDARGLLYYSETGTTVCGVRFANGKFYPPRTKWARTTVFYCVFLEEDVVYVAEKEGAQFLELPLEKDGSLPYSTLAQFFPNARGLMYYTQPDTVLGVRLTRGKFFPNFKQCGSSVFYCVFLEEHQDSVCDNSKSNNGTDSDEEYCTINRVEATSDLLETDFQTVQNEVHDEKLVVDVIQKPGRASAEEYINELPEREILKILMCSEIVATNYHRIVEFEECGKIVEPVSKWTLPKEKFLLIFDLDYRGEGDKDEDSCEQCGSIYSISNKLRPHQCNVCGFRFIRRDHLRRHERIHSGEKPCVCPICNQTFTRVENLKSHTRTSHTINNVSYLKNLIDCKTSN